MATARAATAQSAALWIVAVIATLMFLRAARDLLIPIALAVLISYALEPIVAQLERRRVPRIAGAALALLLVLTLVVGGAYMFGDDLMALIEGLPSTIRRAREMLLSYFGASADALTESATSLAANGEGASTVSRFANTVFAVAGHLVVIVFLIFFLLISGHHISNRLVEISGPDIARRQTMATIIGDINAQIQRYLLVLLVTAIIVAVATWIVLAWLGVRHAVMWAVLAGVFNSIPYFGPVIISGGLFVFGFLQGGGLTAALQMAGASIVITSLEGWLLTPALMGRAERMSALAVFLGLLLWTWVWGAWGTVLAVPMLAVIKSVADHVDRLKPIGRLMAP